VARIARVVWPGCPYHLTHRSNRGARIFFDDADRCRYLDLLRESARRYGLRLWAYALMSNHVHLIGIGDLQDSMARAIGNAHRRYARRINVRNGWTGHLWANRFYSSPLDEIHLWAAVRYVELNPVRAGIVDQAEAYRWSSARVHARVQPDALLDSRRPFPGGVHDWALWLRSGGDDSRFEAIRSCTSTGRPAGSEEFVARLEKQLGRSLRPAKRGPKPTG
jgi:putative transposase